LTNVSEFYCSSYANSHSITGTPEEVSAAFSQSNREYILSKYPKEAAEDFDGLVDKMGHAIIESFVWVLKYYSCGCPSWSWQYQYHYAPPLEYVIPLVDQYDPVFEVGQPNLPFFQQLIIFPPQAAHLLPEPLRPLVARDSPLADLYPLTFETDANGRRASWMAIRKIPIIDFERIRVEYEKVIDQVSEDDADRNEHGKLFVFGTNGCSEIVIDPGRGFEPRDLSRGLPPCVPLLSTLSITIERRVVPVHVFERPYERESLVLKVTEVPPQETADAVAPWLNSEVLVGWPYLRPALIVGAIDADHILREDGTVEPRGSALFPADAVRDSLLTTLATEIGPIKIFLQVRLKNVDGSWSQEKSLAPFQIFLPIDATSTRRNFEAQPVREPEEGELVFMPAGPVSGFVGKIVKRVSPQAFSVEVLQRLQPTGIRSILNADTSQWVTLDALVKAVGGISFRGLRQALSVVIVVPYHVNIAFALFGYEQVIDGCCKGPYQKRLFLANLVPLIQEYFTHTGNLKQLIMSSIQAGEKKFPPLTIEQLFGGSVAHQEAKYAELTQWLTANAPAARFPLVSDSATSLSTKSVIEIENIVTKHKDTVVPKLLDKIGEEFILWKQKPNPRPSEVPPLGARIVSIAPSGAATFGEYGTVIGVDPGTKVVTVLFDHALPCATRLEGRLRTARGLRLHINDVIIISKP
jgi:hypothetical protein